MCWCSYFTLLFQIVRPGGMERPTDSFKETHNITLSEEDTLFGGLVSNLQVPTKLYLQLKFLQVYSWACDVVNCSEINNTFLE